MSQKIIPESVYWEAIRRGINPNTVYYRFRRGWNIKDALERPVKIHKLKNNPPLSIHAQRVLDYKQEALETINVCCDECSLRASYALHEIEELDQ